MLRDFFRDFSDRRPALFGLILVLSLTVLPAAFVLLGFFIGGYDFNSAGAILVFAFLLELAMLFWTERPVMIAAPFLIPLGGLVVLQMVNYMGASLAQIFPAAEAVTDIASFVMITVFGAEVTGCFAAVPVYFIIRLGIFVWEKIKYR